MASRFKSNLTTHIDYSRNYFNIDKMIEVFNDTQISVGQKPSFERKDDHPYNIKSKEKQTEQKHDCSKCNKECYKINEPITLTNPPKLHEFEVDDGVPFGDDEDEVYTCDFCPSLGYTNEYLPEVCNTCRRCEPCELYENGDCEGCGYSVYVDGKYYSEKIPESELFNEDELKKFDSLNTETNANSRVLKDHFSVINM